MPKQPKTVRDEIDALLARSASAFRAAMRDLAVAIARGDNSHNRALDNLRQLAGQTMTLADLKARYRVRLWLKYRRDRVSASEMPAVLAKDFVTPVVPSVPFDEAIRDFQTRAPELAHNAEAVARVYLDKHAFAVAQSANKVVTAKVQDVLARQMAEGRTLAQAVEELQEITGDWTQNYAETVYRTNVMSAYSAGEIREGLQPEVLEVFPAWEFQAVGDSNTRANHQAADGLIAAKTDPVWNNFYPPLGYNCRCAANDVDVYDLEAKNLLTLDGKVKTHYPPSFAAAYPDRHFGGTRPDRRIYQ